MTLVATAMGNQFLALLAVTLLLFSVSIAADQAEPATLEEQLDRCKQLEHGQPEQALELIEPIIVELDAELQPFERIRAIGCRAWSLAVLGRLDETRRDIEQIDLLIPALNEPLEQSRSLRLIASLRNRSGEITASIGALRQALEIAQQHNFEQDLIPIYTNLGIIHSEAKNHDLAIEHYQLALDLAEQQGNPQMRLPILYNLGLTYRGAGQLEAAVSTLEQLLEPLEAPGMEIRLASLLTVLGSVRSEQDQLDQAQSYYERSAALHAELNNPAERSALLIDLSYLALEQERMRSALDYSEQALATARQADYSMSIRGALEARASVLQTAGRADEAIALLREFNQLNEEYLIEQQRSELNKLQAQVGYKRQALELAELRAQQQRQHLVLWSGGIIATLVVFIVVLVF
ncbi:MAG: tetratricopeptide repeat protein, partial [Pseudomonadota bacterium]